ncbi:MAG: hypothetical protein KDB53_07175 [Planctomycetes bacterium]|nr:hypothetical protein [Planctomycetota bacterium]
MSTNETNRPLRVFHKVLKGGLGKGNLGVVMSRHGTGKVAVLTSIAIDNAMKGANTLHAVFGKSVEEVRAYDDEVLHEMIEAYDLKDRAAIMTRVERHKQIYTYRSGDFSVKRLRRTLEFLNEHAQFCPELIEIQGWPDFEKVGMDEMRALKGIAVEFDAEIWVSAHTHRENEVMKTTPTSVSQFDELLSVIIALEPESDHVNLRFVKTKDFQAPDVNLEFDPKTMLVRWH